MVHYDLASSLEFLALQAGVVVAVPSNSLEISTGTDDSFMLRALDLAQQGRTWCSPNAMSGAVVVKDGVVIGEGFNQQPGQPHGEQHALAVAGDSANGSSLYVITEPCTHVGGEGCCDLILKAGVRRVVVAMMDPNPALAGKGIDLLKSAGLEVSLGVQSQKARDLNEAIIKYSVTRRPFVALWAAMSFDGKVATAIGERPAFPPGILNDLHASYDAVLVGVGTILQDDPDISTAASCARNPLRIVIDGMARTPPGCRLLSRPGGRGKRTGTLIVTTRFAPDDRVRDLQEAGAEVVTVPEDQVAMSGDVDLDRLMALLGRREIASVLVEGSGSLVEAALSANIVDKIHAFIYPAVLGGASSPSLVGGTGVSFVEEALQLHRLSARCVGGGLLCEAYLSLI